MKRLLSNGIFALLSFCLTGCDPFNDDILRFQVISEGSFSGITAKTESVVKSQAEWIDLWNLHTSRQSPKPELPNVDFASSLVVAIFAGNKPDSCYRLVLREVSEDGANVTVRYEIVKMLDSGCALILTQPFTMLRIQKPRGMVNFVEEGVR